MKTNFTLHTESSYLRYRKSYNINAYKGSDFIKRFLSIIVLISLIFASSCKIAETSKDSRFTIAVSIPPLKTIVSEVAGKGVDIVTLIPPGNSPANYAPSTGILKKLEDSVIYFSVGVPAEEANIKPKAIQLNKDLIVVNLHETVGKSYPDLYIHEGRDPHIWLSPKRVKIMADEIASQLGAVDPDNADKYKINAETFKRKMDEADAYIKKGVNKLKNKEFLIYHPSLGYFADEYGLKMIAVEHEGKDASIKELGDVIDYAKRKGIKIVLYQAEFDKKQARIVADEIKGEIQMIYPLSEKYPDNLKDIIDFLLKSESR